MGLQSILFPSCRKEFGSIYSLVLYVSGSLFKIHCSFFVAVNQCKMPSCDNKAT